MYGNTSFNSVCDMEHNVGIKEVRMRDIIRIIKEVGDINTINMIKELLLEEVRKIRIDNDNANYEDVLRNQGAIKTLIRVLEYLDSKDVRIKR